MTDYLTIDVQIESDAWRKLWPRAVADVRALLHSFARRPGLIASGDVAVVLGNNARLKALNGQFRGKSKPTNVLSFPDKVQPLGGIALAHETLVREAKEQGKPFLNHAKHMILHGYLHLLGHDHHTARDARLMEGLEIAILSDMGIPNPYLIEAKRRV
jgi:probable rRNA maturation factor